ncbi:MAG TPA: exosortase/archaeosortase family protein, partial [Deltaproteobacteria bacterium]|nr:exosortase/archaeosortase family protein [Deltaproteobacteria bacterium]
MKDGSAKRDLRNFYITIAVLLPLFVVAYWVPIKAIVRVWATDGDYSYGFLVPLISAYLFWDMRHKLKEITFKNNWGIFPLLLILVLASVYAILGSSGNVSRPLVPILLILFLVFCLGIAFVREFLVPLGFLIFMVPLPAYLDRTIGVFLKHISSQL